MRQGSWCCSGCREVCADVGLLDRAEARLAPCLRRCGGGCECCVGTRDGVVGGRALVVGRERLVGAGRCRWWRRQGPQRRRQLALPRLRERGIRGVVSTRSGVAPARRGTRGSRGGLQIACSCQFARVFRHSARSTALDRRRRRRPRRRSSSRSSGRVPSRATRPPHAARAPHLAPWLARAVQASMYRRMCLRRSSDPAWASAAVPSRAALRPAQRPRAATLAPRAGLPRVARGCAAPLHRSTARVVAVQARHRASPHSRGPREKSRRRSRPPGAGRPTPRIPGPGSA